MPYKDPEKQKEYQKDLMRKRRKSNRKSNEIVRPQVRPKEKKAVNIQREKTVRFGIPPGIMYRKKHRDFTLMAYDSKHDRWRPVRSIVQNEGIPELGGLKVWTMEGEP